MIKPTEQARKTLQRLLFPDGRVVIATFQRRQRLAYNDAHALLHELHDHGWLEGLQISHLVTKPAP